MRAAASSQPRIGILGGGIAGMSAALRLQDKGFASTVFESASRIGGRMHSNSDGYWQDGQYAQAYQDFVPVSATLKSQLHQAPFPTVYNSYTAFGQYLDNLSVYDWIETYVPGGNASDFGELLDSAYNQEYGLDTPAQSSLNLVYLLGYQPNRQSPGGFAWYGTSDERYHIAGGNQRLPLAIADYVQAATPACTVRVQWRMTAISVNSDASITCSFSTPSGTQYQTFDEVILTMPFSVLRGLDYSGAGLDPLKQTAIT
jgi:monoamine oxidase